jgi:hypothetical protein
VTVLTDPKYESGTALGISVTTPNSIWQKPNVQISDEPI